MLAAIRSTIHTAGPLGGLTSLAGYLRGSASPSRISFRASALPSPATRKFTARAVFRTGAVSVMRMVLSFGTGLATTKRSATSSAEVSGNRLAVWPSSPIPSRIRSKRGNSYAPKNPRSSSS